MLAGPDRIRRRSGQRGDGALAQRRRGMHLSARGYHRVLKVARTLADLDGADSVGRIHLAER
jgi:magnesium chelatase family protein